MEKGMTILYGVGANLYVNLTNKCPCACVFCLRQNRDSMADNNDTLWLEHEPSFEEVVAEFEKFDLTKYKEVVFCGYGEPTEKLDVLLQVAKYVKENYPNPTRINTNGQGDLIWERDITPDFEGLIDTVSISLNTPDAKKYQELVRSKFGEKSFNAMLNFAKNAKKHVSNVVFTTVATTLTVEEEDKCQAICDELGVTYRIRPWED